MPWPQMSLPPQQTSRRDSGYATARGPSLSAHCVEVYVDGKCEVVRSALQTPNINTYIILIKLSSGQPKIHQTPLSKSKSLLHFLFTLTRPCVCVCLFGSFSNITASHIDLTRQTHFLPFTISSQFGQAVVTLSRLTLYQSENGAWDSAYVKNTINIDRFRANRLFHL